MLSRTTQLTRPNGITTNYNYDSLSHLLSVLHQAGTNTLDGASCTYDPADKPGTDGTFTNFLSLVNKRKRIAVPVTSNLVIQSPQAPSS